MRHRFRFLASYDAHGWRLDEDELPHMLNVLRLKAGEQIELTDAQGHWALATISAVHAKSLDFLVRETFFETNPTQKLIILQAAVKPSSLDELLPPWAELGVDHICIFSQKQTDKKWLSDKVQQRWQRLLKSAVKQSKRNWMPKLEIYTSLGEALTQLEASSLRFLLDPAASQSLLEAIRNERRSVCLAIGSEAGLDPQETQQLYSDGFLATKVSSYILRAYTASIAAASIISATRL